MVDRQLAAFATFSARMRNPNMLRLAAAVLAMRPDSLARTVTDNKLLGVAHCQGAYRDGNLPGHFFALRQRIRQASDLDQTGLDRLTKLFRSVTQAYPVNDFVYDVSAGQKRLLDLAGLIRRHLSASVTGSNVCLKLAS